MSDEKRECWQVGDVVRHVGAEAEWMVDAVHGPERYDVTCVQTDGHHATGKVVLATPLKRTELVRRAQKPTGPVSKEPGQFSEGDRVELPGRYGYTGVVIGARPDRAFIRRDDGRVNTSEEESHHPCWLCLSSFSELRHAPPESGAQSSPGGSADASGTPLANAQRPPGLSFPEYPEHPAYAISSPSPRAPDPGPREQLAAFEAAVAEHLVPLLPKGWHVVTDTCRQADEEHGDYNGFALFVLEGSRVVYHDSYDKPITAREADAMRMTIAAGEFDLTRKATGERRS